MPSRRALLATLGSAVAAGCLGGGSTPTDVTDSDSPTSAPTRSPTETAPLTGKDPDCTTVTKLDENYDLAVVATDARKLPLDLVVSVSRTPTPLDTYRPTDAVPNPDETEDEENTARSGDATVYRERFVLSERYEPHVRRDVIGDGTDYVVRVRAGDSGFSTALFAVTAGEQAGLDILATREGIVVGQDGDRRLVGTPCPG
ncbi:MAG: hypothetical protein ABEI99_11065 [Halobaculum sp.]